MMKLQAQAIETREQEAKVKDKVKLAIEQKLTKANEIKQEKEFLRKKQNKLEKLYLRRA